MYISARNHKLHSACSTVNWKLIIKLIMSGNFFHYQFLLHLTVLENTVTYVEMLSRFVLNCKYFSNLS